METFITITFILTLFGLSAVRDHTTAGATLMLLFLSLCFVIYIL